MTNRKPDKSRLDHGAGIAVRADIQPGHIE